MPLEYSGVVAEHDAIREVAGVFDVSHLGTLKIIGPGTVEQLDALLTNSLARLLDAQAQYTLLCAEDGGVIDDMIAYRVSQNEVLLVPNAANATEVGDVIRRNCPDLKVIDEHRSTAVLALQGPASDNVLAELGLPTDIEYMGFAQSEFAGATVTICRTGYTGERGVEILVPATHAPALWEALIADDRVSPCGLGARDTLRLEMGYALHGQDLGPDISPVMAGLNWAVDWDKPEFSGREALMRQRSAEADHLPRLRGLRMIDRGVPRSEMAVFLEDAQVGRVTSGTFSPTLKRGIALALLDQEVNTGTEVSIDVRGRRLRAEVCVPPFVPSRVRDVG